jgi:hypothetical protein
MLIRTPLNRGSQLDALAGKAASYSLKSTPENAFREALRFGY